MRIVLINWARIEQGASQGGGINGYAQALGEALVSRGHEVVSLCGGTCFVAGPGTREPGPCVIERRPDWRRIRIHEVVNSPVQAPAMPQFADPMGEVSAPELEQLVGALMGELSPDVVHIHSLEGFSAGCVDQIRRRTRARIVFSLHNYHTICPQVYLLQGHRRPCFSFEQGHACATCIRAVDPREQRRRRAEWQSEGGPPPSAPAPVPPARPGSPETMPLSNEARAEPACDRAPNDYARRRVAMIAMLNRCDRILAVSDFVRRKFEALGVDPEKITVLHLGTRMVDCVAASGLGPRTEPCRAPVRMAFMGYNNYAKGLPMLADSLESLSAQALAAIRLSVFAHHGEGIEPRFTRLGSRLAGLDFRPGYAFDEVPGLLIGEAIDLGVVPSVWWDNGPQTVLEFLACGVPVLGANLGGIPDFVREGENGLLFRGNDRQDLARRLTAVAANPGMIDRLRAGVRRPHSIREHTATLEEVYAGRVLSYPPPTPASENSPA